MHVSFQLSPELHADAVEAAQQRELTLSAWIRQAMFAYIRSSKRNNSKYTKLDRLNWPSGYPKNAVCIACDECHGNDPALVHPDYEFGKPEIAWARQNECKS